MRRSLLPNYPYYLYLPTLALYFFFIDITHLLPLTSHLSPLTPYHLPLTPYLSPL